MHVNKYLGVLLDERLDFNKHTSYLKGIIATRIYQLNKIRSYIDVSTALLLYKSIILSYFDSGDVFYNFVEMTVLKSFQVLQNGALHCILNGDRYSNMLELHKKANLTMLRDRRKLNLVAMAHDRNIPQFGLASANERQLRSNNKMLLIVPFANNIKFEKSFIMQAIKLWNGLPENLKTCQPTQHFKSRDETGETKFSRVAFELYLLWIYEFDHNTSLTQLSEYHIKCTALTLLNTYNRLYFR